ncbi:MAG: DUF1156 domain-containing protein [bacterium]|nr:DUF1156 domain-containing protein [bacterium]
MTDSNQPRLLIEDWFPVAELGIESVRERAVAMDLPPLFALHVWWARRPLVASAGAVLGSLLPAWSSELAAEFCDHDQLATPLAYQQWFLHLCGIWGDPVEARKLLDAANAAGVKLKGNGYGYKQAYKNSPNAGDLSLLHQVLQHTWGRLPSVCDPTAGGGSIPYEAVRYRLPTHANDLNPVAASVLRTGVELSARHGLDITADLQQWGQELVGRLANRLSPHFELPDTQEKVVAYIFARTVACPRTGKMVPLVGDWALRRGDKPVAVRLVTRRGDRELDEPEFEIVEGHAIDFDPKREATWSRGKAVSPWDHLTIDSGYIKAEAQAGHMGEVLYAVAIRTASGRGFRAPDAVDLNTLAAAEAELERLLPQWEAADILPSETVPKGNKTREPHNYGMPRWRDFFTPRQLLVHGCFVEEFRKLIGEVRAAIDDPDRADAVLALLSFIQGKGLTYNARQSAWDISRQKIAQAFSMHAFPLKHTFAEFEGATELFQWCLQRGIIRAYNGIAGLLHPNHASNQLIANALPEPQVTVTSENAGNLASLSDGSQTLVCIDPPYYDNVMYAELSDFFYVWEKRTLGALWPELFAEPLTNKHDEAVTNRARFAHAGRRAKELADHDYTAKMAAVFAECRRVLADNGVLTVMFTHKRADAWDALGTALITTGFTIETSWPVHTESEQSLHQARQNSAKSTVFMVCRKRSETRSGQQRTYLDDIEGDIRHAAGDALERAAKQGLSGVDLLLSTYGPALSALSARWPVYSAEADAEGRSRLLRPEEALIVARAEGIRLLRARLVGSDTDFDPLTDFMLMAWDMFCAREFPYDEARKLALATGGLETAEVERAKLITAKSGSVVISEPHQRLRREGDDHLPGVNRERRSFPTLIDAVHTALYITDQDGPAAARRWLSERGLITEGRFSDCLQALLRAVPRTRASGKWNLPEAELLDRLATTCFPDLDIPPDPLDITEQQLFSPDG